MERTAVSVRHESVNGADVLVRSSQDVIANTDFQSALFCGAVKSAPARQHLRAADEDVRAPERGIYAASLSPTIDAFLFTMEMRICKGSWL